jgi:hypothetical protein
MSASVENPLDCLLWQQAFAAKYDSVGRFDKEHWDSLLGHCQVNIISPRSTLIGIDNFRPYVIGPPLLSLQSSSPHIQMQRSS